MENIERVNQLFHSFVNKSASLEETQELFAWIADAQNDEALPARLEELHATGGDLPSMPDWDWDFIFQQAVAADKKAAVPAKIRFFQTSWLRYAAILLLVLGTGGYFFYNSSKESITKTNNYIPDIAPGGNKAVLVLADGSTIVLDSAANGNVASQGSVRVIKLSDGQLAYHASASLEGSPRGAADNGQAGLGEPSKLFNTVSTPRGGQYQLVLSDGSKVWLNAASSVRFPAIFNGKERRIEITGEVYLEVKADARQPFFVSSNGAEIQVLGTAFNLNAYREEETIKTTLVEGSVRVNTTLQSQLLKPGQQSSWNSSTSKMVVQDANISQVTAWKNGLFNFDGASLKEVMNQLARWYDIEVVYEKGIPDISFFGKINRKADLSSVLKGLADSKVNFKIEKGSKLIVTP